MKPLLFLFLFATSTVWGTEYAPTTGLLDTIKYWVSQADTSDIVNVPAGTWNWKIWSSGNPSLTLNKPIYLKGSGHSTCIITCDTSTVSGERLINIVNKSTHWARISGFTFNNALYTDGTKEAINAGNKNIRIDHCVFGTSVDTRGIWINGEGLIDSCYFYNHTQGVAVEGVISTSDTYDGDSLWAATGSDVLGTTHAVYIENCRFLFTDMNDGAFDSYVGKVVFRHNYVLNTNVGWHGFDTGPRRSAIGYEIYANTFVWESENNLFCNVNNRGGTGVIYDNISTGVVSDMILLQNYRSRSAGPDGDVCDGNAALDENTPDSNGWLCYDQVGAGVDQANVPIYCWNNILNGDTIVPTVWGEQDTQHIKINRDYFATSKPGYTALDYPYPFDEEQPVSIEVVIKIGRK